MNTEYHKIQTVFLRDPATNNKRLLEGQFSLPEFEYLKDNEWVFTEKVDGTNIRVMYDDAMGIAFGGKTDNAQINVDLVVRLQQHFLPLLPVFHEKFDADGPVNVTLYGEGYGAKIQKGGGNYSPDPQFVLFDVNIDGWWLKRKAVEDIAFALNLMVVPIIGHGTLWDMVEMTRPGFKSRWGDFTAEGIVARPAVELKSRAGHRIITKIKHKDFL